VRRVELGLESRARGVSFRRRQLGIALAPIELANPALHEAHRLERIEHPAHDRRRDAKPRRQLDLTESPAPQLQHQIDPLRRQRRPCRKDPRRLARQQSQPS
jgi:hypothetical protein